MDKTINSKFSLCLGKFYMFCVHVITVDVERFSGLNAHSFSPIEVFVFIEIFLRCLGKKCSLFSVIKERCLYSRKNFYSTLENHENRKV